MFTRLSVETIQFRTAESLRGARQALAVPAAGGGVSTMRFTDSAFNLQSLARSPPG
jgi:hypothetical protein